MTIISMIMMMVVWYQYYKRKEERETVTIHSFKCPTLISDFANEYIHSNWYTKVKCIDIVHKQQTISGLKGLKNMFFNLHTCACVFVCAGYIWHSWTHRFKANEYKK